MRWTWDPANRAKHGLSFETAVLVGFLGRVGRLLGSLQRSFGRKREIDACRQVELRVEGVQLVKYLPSSIRDPMDQVLEDFSWTW